MAEKIEMELLRAHRHDGVDLQPPAKIMVDARKVNWMVNEGIAKKSGTGGPKPAPRDA